MREFMLRFGRGAVRLFRANAGMAWTGRVVARNARTITIENPRPFHGMPDGFADLIGWRSIVVDESMVGQRVALFVALEVKHGKGRTSAAQRRFHDAVHAAGGIAIIARDEQSVADALGPGTVPPA